MTMGSSRAARIGVFGGSFNPPHLSHVLAGACALGSGEIDRLIVVPTYRHPFGKDLAPFERRLEMCRLAFSDLARTEVSGIEQDLGEPSRTLHTIRALRERNPGAAFRLVVGADVLAESDKWYRWEELREEAPPLVMGRAGTPPVPGAYPDLPAIRSTDVRERLARNEPDAGELGRLVPATVLAYAREHRLYRGG